MCVCAAHIRIYPQHHTTQQCCMWMDATKYLLNFLNKFTNLFKCMCKKSPCYLYFLIVVFIVFKQMSQWCARRVCICSRQITTWLLLLLNLPPIMTPRPTCLATPTTTSLCLALLFFNFLASWITFFFFLILFLLYTFEISFVIPSKG